MTETPATPPALAIAALATDLRVLVGGLKRRLRDQAPTGDLTGAQAAVLGRLERHGPATVIALADHEGVQPEAMAGTVAALARAGLVERSAEAADGRQTLLTLTPACRAWVAAGRAAREDWLARAIEATFTPAEHDDLARAIALLRRLAAR